MDSCNLSIHTYGHINSHSCIHRSDFHFSQFLLRIASGLASFSASILRSDSSRCGLRRFFLEVMSPAADDAKITAVCCQVTV
jgi:hypothetical protein